MILVLIKITIPNENIYNNQNYNTYLNTGPFFHVRHTGKVPNAVFYLIIIVVNPCNSNIL